MDNIAELNTAIEVGHIHMVKTMLGEIHKAVDMADSYAVAVKNRRVEICKIMRDHGCWFKTGNVLDALANNTFMLEFLPNDCIKNIPLPFVMACKNTELTLRLMNLGLKPELRELDRIIYTGNIDTITIALASLKFEDIQQADKFYTHTNLANKNENSVLSSLCENPFTFIDLLKICNKKYYDKLTELKSSKQ
jgi:hypothetical protein